MEEPGGHVSYQQRYVRCGKAGCRRCADGLGHGPYWYSSRREGARVRTRYIGKTLPPGIVVGNREASSVTAGSPPEPTNPLSVEALSSTAPCTLAPASVGVVVHGAAPKPAPSLRIWTLGRFQVESAGVAVPERAWRRQAGTIILKLLLLADYRRLPRDHIAAHLWPDSDPNAAREQLAGAVHALRRALEPALAAGEPSRYLQQEGVNLVLQLGPRDWVDYLVFEQLLVEAGAAANPLPLLEQAVSLYSGDLMPEEQNSWCVAAREGLRLRWYGVLLSLAEAQVGERQVDAAAVTLSRLLKEDPTNEEAARRLIGLLGRQGRRTEALRLYDRLRDALAEELGVDPAPETEALAEALRGGTPLPRARRAIPPEQAVVTAPRPSLSPLIGRVTELERLRVAMLAAREGTGQMLLLTGTAGIGKTRLAEEGAIAAGMLGMTVLWGRAAESEMDLPYAPIAEALRAYIHTRPGPALLRDLVGATAVRRLLPELGILVPGLAEPAVLENAGDERLRLWTAIHTLLLAATKARPIFLILEDLQWADDASLGLLTFLMRRCRAARLVVLGTVRDDEIPAEHPIYKLRREGRREGILDLVPIGGLTPDQVGEMASRQLGGVVGQAQSSALHVHCAGNPLFIRELLALAPERTRAETDDVLAAVLSGTDALPTGIRQTLSRRLEGISTQTRIFLEIAAVIGERFSSDTVERVADMDADDFAGALDAAIEGGLVREIDNGESGNYAPAHPLLRRVLYDEIAPSRRRRLHGRIAAELIASISADETPHAALIAHHVSESDDRIDAALWLERAGDQAWEVYAGAAAFALYTRALGISAGPSALVRNGSQKRLDRQARLSEKLGDLLMLQGEYEAAQAHFARARDLEDDQDRQAELWRKEGVTWDKRGDFGRALDCFDQATVGGEGGDRPLSAVVRAELELSRGNIHWGRGDFEEVAAAAERALDVLRETPEGSGHARAAYLFGHVAAMRGEYTRAEEYYRHSLSIRERMGDQHGLALCWTGLGLVAYDRGDPAHAEEYHRCALAIRERIGDQEGVVFSWSWLMRIAQYRGQYARVEECERHCTAERERLTDRPGFERVTNQSARLARERGDHEEATALIEHGLRIQKRIGDQWGQSNSLTDLGETARERGDFVVAECRYRESLAIKEPLGDQLGIARCLNGLGILARERGELDTAARLGRQARRLAKRIGARNMEILASLSQGSTALRAGRARLAEPLIAHGGAQAREYGAARTIVLATLAMADLRRGLGRPAEAIAAAREALRLAACGSFRGEETRAQGLLDQYEST
jgi:DNA-binding SARP family transcriptional activator